MTSSLNIEQAEHVVSEYGKLLSSTEPSVYGIAISRLPYSKEEIKTAIQTLLLALDKQDRHIQDSLTQAYVYLAQFIDDDRLAIAERGRQILEKETVQPSASACTTPEQDTEDLELANQAVQTINGIKSEMETLMSEIRLLLS